MYIYKICRELLTFEPYIFSGIYQQLIKNLFFRKNQSKFYNFKRKVNEYIMTMFLNLVYSKELILEYYLNCLLLIDYNNNEVEFYGINNIANRLFNKDVNTIDVFESCFIVATLTDPINFYADYKKNKICPYVIFRMKNMFKKLLNKKLIDDKEYLNLIKKIDKYRNVNNQI